ADAGGGPGAGSRCRPGLRGAEAGGRPRRAGPGDDARARGAVLARQRRQAARAAAGREGPPCLPDQARPAQVHALVRRARLRGTADRERRPAPPRRRSRAPRRGARARERKAAGSVRIAVCMPQVPFERGGTEIFAEGLVGALRAQGHETELVTVPYKWYPAEQVLTQAFLWRLLDLEESAGRPIDAVIATKFPSYGVRHRNKVVWLLHQFRQAWDLDRTELGQFSESAEDRALRRKVLEFDRVTLGEARKIFTTSSIVAGRLRDSTGLEAEVLAPPPAPLDFRCTAYEDFILSVNRLDRAKRIDLLLEAAAKTDDVRVVI